MDPTEAGRPMSPAQKRFDELRGKFRAMVPSPKLTRKRRHAIAWAASLQQVLEMAVAEMVLGAPHERRLLEEMKSEVTARLASAGARINQRSRET